MSAQQKYNDFLIFLEDKGLIKRTPGFIHSYEKKYPYFKELEKNQHIIKEECQTLLKHAGQLHDVEGMAGNKTRGGISSAIQWKQFMFKAGTFVEENCALCPETAKMLKRVPRIKQAFFSILYPNQYITPHRGYFYGFLRYHLGVIVPYDNKDEKCWIRINDNISDNNNNYNKHSIEKGDKYYWKEGKGIMFNDNYVHDASNESDQIRVVLWLDVVRKFPFWINWLNSLALFIAYKNKTVQKVAKDAVVHDLAIDKS